MISPAELTRLGEVTGAAGVSIRGLAAVTGEGRGIIHVLVDDDVAVRATDELRRAGLGVAAAQEVLVIDVVDRPGSLGELAEANVNIDLAYTTFGGIKLAGATEDIDSARAVLG